MLGRVPRQPASVSRPGVACPARGGAVGSGERAGVGETDDGGTYTVAYDTRLTLTATQRVWIDWTYGGVVICVLSADPITHDDLIPEPAGRPTASSGGAGFDVTRVFNPVTSGTQNTGQARLWTSQVYCGDTTVGGFFYADQVGSTIPDTAVIKSVRLFVNQESGRGNQPTIGLHSLAKPGGVIAVDQAVAIPSGTGWKTLPNAFGDALKTGYRKGFGTNHGGFWIWARRQPGQQRCPRDRLREQLMAGRTGYTGIAANGPMRGPEQITDVYEWFDPLIDGVIDKAANLPPATSTFPGREVP